MPRKLTSHVPGDLRIPYVNPGGVEALDRGNAPVTRKGCSIHPEFAGTHTPKFIAMSDVTKFW